MAAINDLISQIQDETLRNRIQEEVSKMAKQKKFGLVFEEHMPESTPLYDMPIKRGCNVMRRDSKDDKSIYVVLRVEGDTAVCVKPEQKDEAVTFDLKDIVRVAEFGESIYPYLKPLDSVCNAPDSDLWHTLIEADNYHALQLLEYLYAGKVDCIYIDPPYNTGAKDWKYNNDYVDGNDAYRHSKWLSFMQRRLQLAKKLLNPEDSVLIVTIDEKEYLHLGCLLEEMFPEARMQMVSSMINPANVARVGEFGRSGEYLFFVMLGKSSPQRVRLSREWVSSKGRTHTGQVRWDLLKRSGTNSERKHSPGGFYPIYINDETGKIEEIGDPLAPGVSVAPIREGCTALLPIRQNGSEGNWQWATDTFRSRMAQGRVRIGGNKSRGFTVYILKDGEYSKIVNGEFEITGHGINNEIIVADNDTDFVLATPGDIWRIPAHDATQYGSRLIGNIFSDRRFTFPKSLFAVKDCLYFFTANKPNALVVDFFAGSGTTLHAVNLLNAEDGGHRRCIMVTNNEVSADEAKMLKDKGYQPAMWNGKSLASPLCYLAAHGLLHRGARCKWQTSQGRLSCSEPPIHMADGFKANAAFFKLGFLDSTAVSLGMRFSEMLPTLWLKTGAKGKCPELTGEQMPDRLILPENQFAVLINENSFADFAEKLAEHPEIQTVFLATDYEVNYQSMVKNLNVTEAYQLYRDYLDHFRMNRGRN